MAAVLVGSNTYDSYVDLVTADEYLEAASHAANWQAETSDDIKGRYLVTATRLLERQRWKGDAASSTQTFAWPRTGTGITGVEDNVIPQNILDACCEIASALADGSDVQSAQNQAQKIQTMKAGSVSLTYFRGADGTPRRFPQIIQELLRDYLAGSSSSLGSAQSSDVDTESITARTYEYAEPL